MHLPALLRGSDTVHKRQLLRRTIVMFPQYNITHPTRNVTELLRASLAAGALAYRTTPRRTQRAMPDKVSDGALTAEPSFSTLHIMNCIWDDCTDRALNYKF